MKTLSRIFDKGKLNFIFLIVAAGIAYFPVKAQNAGEIWGMTTAGGISGVGVIFKTASDGSSLTVKHNFSSPGGSTPRNSLFQSKSGKVYGTTATGGTGAFGTLFELNLVTGTPIIKVNFGDALGNNPDGAVIEYNGILYGLAATGGINNGGLNGTIYSYDPVNNTASKLLNFADGLNGSWPNVALIVANGKLYGTTRIGGANNLGVLFEYDPASKTYSKKHDFTTATGGSPRASLILASNGKLYGNTNLGGANNRGVLYEYDINTNTYTNKVDRSSILGYGFPGPMVEGPSGKLYSVTQQGGSNGLGVIFEFDINSSSYQVKYDFSVSSGTYSNGGLLLAANGKLYGMAQEGGTNNLGTFYEFDPSTSIFTVKTDFTGTNGANPAIVRPIQLQQLTQSITFTTLSDIAETAGTFTLSASASSGLPVTFTSQNTDKITITGQNVAILAPGKVTIKATQEGNINYKSTEVVSQTICILPKKPSITASGIGTGNTALTSSSTSGNQWYRNGMLLIGATGPSLAINATGLYTVKVTIEGCSGDFSEPFNVIITDVVDTEHAISLSLYPNPVGQVLRIKLTGMKEDEPSELRVYDFSGRLMSQQAMKGGEAQLSIGQYSSGSYVLLVSSKAIILNTRFVKQ